VVSHSVAVTLACGTDAGRSRKIEERAVHGAIILEVQMAGTVARVTEISAKSDTSFEDATEIELSALSQYVTALYGAVVTGAAGGAIAGV
jgi:hypothetical protein